MKPFTRVVASTIGIAVAFVTTHLAPATPAAAATSDPHVVADSSETEPDDVPPDIAFYIDILLGVVSDEEANAFYQRLDQEREHAIQTCMNDAGFDYHISDSPVENNVDQVRGDLEWAQQWGFGNYPAIDRDHGPWTDDEYEWANEELIDALEPPEQDAWFEMHGRCMTQAANQGDPTNNPVLMQVLSDFEDLVMTDPRVLEATTEWSDCMSEAGHTYTNPDEMYQAWFDFDRLREFIDAEAWKPESPKHDEWRTIADKEIAVAVANITCIATYDETIQQVRDSHRTALATLVQTADWNSPSPSPGSEPDSSALDTQSAAAETSDQEPEPTTTTDSDTPDGGLDLSQPSAFSSA